MALLFSQRSLPALVCSCLPVLRPASRLYAWWALLVLVLDLSYTAVVCPVSVAYSPRAALISWVGHAAGWGAPEGAALSQSEAVATRAASTPVPLPAATAHACLPTGLQAFVIDFVAGLLFTLDIAVNFHVGYVAEVRAGRASGGQACPPCWLKRRPCGAALPDACA